MALENSLSMEPVKEKLRALPDYMPKEDDTLYQFGAFLAERFHDSLVPEGFMMGAELALYDLQTGVDGFSGQPIRSRLVGSPPMIYGLLRMRVPDIAEAVCPPEFAEGVRNMYDTVNQSLKENNS